MSFADILDRHIAAADRYGLTLHPTEENRMEPRIQTESLRDRTGEPPSPFAHSPSDEAGAPPIAAMVHINEIGNLPTLTNEEHLALVVGLGMVARGEEPTPNVATVCIHTLARLAGIPLPPVAPTIIEIPDTPEENHATDDPDRS